MEKKVIVLEKGQTIDDIYDRNLGEIDADEIPDVEEELIVEYRGELDGNQ